MIHLSDLNRDVLRLLCQELDIISLCRWARVNRKFYCLISDLNIYKQSQKTCRYHPKLNWLKLCFRENYFELARRLVRAEPRQLCHGETAHALMDLGCLNGRTEMVKWLISLTSKEKYQSKMDINFSVASSWCRFDLCQYLASEFTIEISTLRSALLIHCSKGNLAFCQVLYDLDKHAKNKSSPDSDFHLQRHVFTSACHSGKINVIRWALTLFDPAGLFSLREKMNLFQPAVEAGYLDIARVLQELFPNILLIDFHKALVVNCGIGNVWMLRWLLEIYEPEGKTTYFTAMFQAAIIRGRNNILAYLWEPGRLPENKLLEMFASACSGPHLSTAQWLWENTLNRGQDVISMDWSTIKLYCRKEVLTWIESLEK